jgi:SAM-dependent methyltransferase
MAELAATRGIATEIATFEEWDARGRAFDIVVSAQAWHWVDPVAGAAKAADVLRPRGRLALFWNAFDPPASLREEFADVFRRVLPDSPFGAFWARSAVETYRAGVASAAGTLRAAGLFTEPEEWLDEWEQPYTRDQWLDFLPTTGGFTRMPPDVRQALLDGHGAVVDQAGGSFVMSFTSVTAAALRLG